MCAGKNLRGLKYLEQAYYMMKQRPEDLAPYTGFKEAVRKFNFLTGTWRKLGLYHDDLLHEDDVVAEAIRRLPLKMQDDRNFRLIRAIQCDVKHVWLSEEEWTTYEADITKGRYMQPYIEDVIKEVKQRDAWEAEH